MIRTKGEAGTGDVVEAVKHMRTVKQDIARAQGALSQGEGALRALAKRDWLRSDPTQADCSTRKAASSQLCRWWHRHSLPMQH